MTPTAIADLHWLDLFWDDIAKLDQAYFALEFSRTTTGEFIPPVQLKNISADVAEAHILCLLLTRRNKTTGRSKAETVLKTYDMFP